MEIKFYNNISDNDDVKKSITHIATFDCDIYNDCSIYSPSIIVPMSDALINANYCRIEKFKRYYYITNQTIYSGDLVKIDLRCDVLMSFWNSFSKSKCIAKRSSSHQNPNIPDECDVYKPQSKFIRRKDRTSFTPTSTGGCYILTLGGK